MTPSDTFLMSPTALAARVFALMAAGGPADFEQVIHPDGVNREAFVQPPSARGTGPRAWYETALWLRNLAEDVHWQIHESVATDHLVAVFCTMSGHHTGEHTHYDAEGQPSRVMPPSGKPFATTQSHWFRISDGKVIEHWANRDDLGIAVQLDWLAPAGS